MKIDRTARLAMLSGVAAASLALADVAYAASRHDVVKDFGIESNPNGLWTYILHVPLTEKYHSFEGVAGLDCWSNGNPKGSGVVVARNTTGQTVTLENGTLNFPPDYLLIDVKQNEPGVIVQFEAPTTGSYTIKGNFVGEDTNEGSDVQAVIYLGNFQGGKQLFYTQIRHFRPRKFNVTTAMQAGQVIQFFVVRSPTEKPDYVGLQAKITGP